MDESQDRNPHKDQEEWERHQIAGATMTYGAKDKKQAEQYDLVFEDQIEFITSEALAGNLVWLYFRVLSSLNFLSELLFELLFANCSLRLLAQCS